MHLISVLNFMLNSALCKQFAMGHWICIYDCVDFVHNYNHHRHYIAMGNLTHTIDDHWYSPTSELIQSNNEHFSNFKNVCCVGCGRHKLEDQ